jgi:hypothetical protein
LISGICISVGDNKKNRIIHTAALPNKKGLLAILRIADFIQGAMGWELAHLFSYKDGRGHGCQISSELRLCDVCRVGDALTNTYTYDFGDDQHPRVRQLISQLADITDSDFKTLHYNSVSC